MPEPTRAEESGDKNTPRPDPQDMADEGLDESKRVCVDTGLPAAAPGPVGQAVFHLSTQEEEGPSHEAMPVEDHKDQAPVKRSFHVHYNRLLRARTGLNRLSLSS